jgi:hypothetical protein
MALSWIAVTKIVMAVATCWVGVQRMELTSGTEWMVDDYVHEHSEFLSRVSTLSIGPHPPPSLSLSLSLSLSRSLARSLSLYIYIYISILLGCIHRGTPPLNLTGDGVPVLTFTLLPHLALHSAPDSRRRKSCKDG